MIPESRLFGLRTYTYTFLMTKEGASRCVVGRFCCRSSDSLSVLHGCLAVRLEGGCLGFRSLQLNASASASLSPISCLSDLSMKLAYRGFLSAVRDIYSKGPMTHRVVSIPFGLTHRYPDFASHRASGAISNLRSAPPNF
jgi:hypothetical protein